MRRAALTKSLVGPTRLTNASQRSDESPNKETTDVLFPSSRGLELFNGSTFQRSRLFFAHSGEMARVLLKGLLAAAVCFSETYSTIHVEMCLNDRGNVIPCEDISMTAPASFADHKKEEQLSLGFDASDVHKDLQVSYFGSDLAG